MTSEFLLKPSCFTPPSLSSIMRVSKIINYYNMSDNVLRPRKLDKTETWIENKKGAKSCVPNYIAMDLLKDLNRGYKLCEPDFVPGKKLKPFDEEKKGTAQKRANTELTSPEVEELLGKSFDEIKDLAKEREVSVQGLRSKKAVLEKMEKEKKLF